MYKEIIKTVKRFCRRKLALLGLIILIFIIISVVFSDFIIFQDPFARNVSARFQPPSREFLFGTDSLGRDVFARTLLGGKVSLFVSVTSISWAFVIGVFLGTISGYWGKWIEEVIMRIMDTIWSFPSIILALAISAALGPNPRNVMIALALVNIPAFSRISRGQVLNIKNHEFVEATRAIGLSSWRTLFRHILPNIIAPLIIQATLSIGHAIIAEASLSFLGLGVQPPHPSWGNLLRTGYREMSTAPWLSIYPGVAIFLTVLSFNLVGDGLRDAFDVKI